MRHFVFLIIAFLCATSILSVLTSCNTDFGKLFSEEKKNYDRGYTLDELDLFYNFAKLAAIKYNNLNSTHLEELGEKLSYAVKTKIIEYDSLYGIEAIKNSASIVYPVSPSASISSSQASNGWPILISMHHTLLRDEEAPSAVADTRPSFSFDSIASFDPNLHPLLLSASMGFVVYAPDMLGFGSSKEKGHPFMNKSMLVEDIYKGLVASIAGVEDLGVKVDTQKVFITGYSHGGWVATQFYEYLNNNHAEEFNVLAGVSSAGVYYLQDMIRDLLVRESSSLPLFFPYMVYGYEVSNTVDIDYANYYNEPYASLDFAGDLFDGTHNNQYVDSKLSSDIATLYNPDFLTSVRDGSVADSEIYGAFWTRAMQDSVQAWNMSGKLLIIHHEDDEVSQISQIESFISDMEAVNGQNSADVESLFGVWGEGSAHEATALITYISGLHWLVAEKEKF